MKEIRFDVGKIKDGENLQWFAGNRYSGFKKIIWRKNRREWRYIGHDGTSNSFFFDEFNEAVSVEEALVIAYKAGCREAVRKLFTKLTGITDEDEIADFFNMRL